MPKLDPTSPPATMSGRVIARLDDIEAWFRSGYRTQEVLEMLGRDGIKLHKVKFRQLLARYGKSESAVRRAMAAQALPAALTPKTAKIEQPPASGDIVAGMKEKDARRVEFRPDPNPRAEDLY